MRGARRPLGGRRTGPAGLLRPGVDATSVALLAAALNFADLMAIALDNSAEDQRVLTSSLSNGWHEVFAHGALARPSNSQGR